MPRTPVADWQQLSALYEQADTLGPEPLGDWLAQLEQQSHPLLPQLRQMLAARSQVRHNGFLGTLPRLATAPEPRAIEWHAGSRIGPYKLLRRLGSGGMAEVWLAQRVDGAFQRQVAIKLLFRHAGSSGRDTFAQRFDRERDILASLNHPHIAGLHDAGVTPGGQPWLALEYVEGETLTDWCDGRSLGVEPRVRLFRQVLLAVQHAHANLVMHRDLKPGNILVTEQGEVRLLDFGIAKLMEPEGTAAVETELTRMAGRPMTPQYAAPEQLLGQPLTTACDVYSLGVVLYELLCGERPYELKVESAAQLEQAILDMEPRAPSRRALGEATAAARGTTSALLRKLLGRDLDAIVLRALAKQPARRYGSVEALGADLDRWLGGEPVEARAPSTVYRVGKFVRRHVLSVSLGAGAVVALASVAAVAVVMGLQAREDSRSAIAARDFMLGIFARADQEKSRGADITARDLLETGRKDVLIRLAGQPKLQAELLRGIANIQSDMGEFSTADATFAELVRIYALLGERRHQAMAMVDHAFNALQTNDVSLAARLLKEARTAIGKAAVDHALEARFAEVEGRIALAQGDVSLARRLLAEAHGKALRYLGKTDLQTFTLGQALVRAERDLRHTDAALALLDDLTLASARVEGLHSREVAAMDWERVGLLVAAGRFRQASTLLETVLPRCVDRFGPQDQSCRFLFLTQGQTLLRLGYSERALQNADLLRAIGLDDTAPIQRTEALLLEFRLRSTQRVDVRKLSLRERLMAFGQSGDELPMKPTFKAAALLALSEADLRSGQPVEAGQLAARALAMLGNAPAKGGALRIVGIAGMLEGVALLHQGKLEAALLRLAAAKTDLDEAFGADHPTTALFALNNALALAALGRAAEAADVARRSESVLRDALGTDAPTYRQAADLAKQLDHAAAGGSDTPEVAEQNRMSGRKTLPTLAFFS